MPSMCMGRKPREEFEGAIHHVYARGNNRQAVFHDDADRRLYLALLACVACDRDWLCLGYCLMTNHVHLLLETPKANLALGMRDLQRDYTRAFNDRHQRVDHVFQKPYRSKRVKDDGHLHTVIAYIAQNPVAAGLVSSPDDFRWSSHGALAAGMPPPWLAFKRVLEYLAIDSPDPGRRYHELVATTNPQVDDVPTRGLFAS
ncbi:MAG: transposase [Thermoleophilaceae bacterium]